MINRIIKILLLGVMFIALLSFGGYTWQSFKSEVHLKDPKYVLRPITQYIPDLPSGSGSSDKPSTTESSGNDKPNTTDPDNPTIDNPIKPNSTENQYVDDDGNLKKQDIKTGKSELSISYARSIKVNIDGKEIELTSKNTINFIKWLSTNYKEDSKVSLEVEKDEDTSTESSNNTDEVKYNDILESSEDLDTLIKSIRVIDKLPDYDDYDRTTYEKPVQGYKLNGTKVNRNDYAWKTSPWFDEETYTYMCPYTGTIITDMDDKKEDKDFGTLDYDHIVPLKSTYLRGAKDWTQEQMNAYAYDQWVGVDVLNSANRSKSDKGPCEYMTDINQEDYCYSWLMICSKYNLAMTQEEIDLCKDTIEIAIENGETVEFLGGKMPTE